MGGMNRAIFPEQHQSVAGLMAYFRRAIEETRPAPIDQEPKDIPRRGPSWTREAEGYRMLNKRRAKRRRRNQLRRAQRQHVRRKRGRSA